MGMKEKKRKFGDGLIVVNMRDSFYLIYSIIKLNICAFHRYILNMTK